MLNFKKYLFSSFLTVAFSISIFAQEVEEVLPEIVDTREDGYKAVKYEKMVALLIEGMKEQQEQINKLTSRLNDIEKGE